MKSKLIKIFAAVAALLCLASCGNGGKAVSLAEAEISSNEAVTLISHRGMSIYAPENTVEAAEKSAAAGYKYVEFDVRRTLDGVWVLMHDSDIERMTDGEGEISEMTYKQLISFSVDEGNGLDEYELVTVPTLETMLAACQENGLKPVIEIKQSGTEYIKELLNIIADRWSSRCMIIAFDREQTELVYSILQQGKTTLKPENVTVMWLTSDLSEKTLETAKANTGIGVSFNGNKAGSAEEIKAFTDAGIELAVWTVNKPKRLKELYDLGITCFTTDNIVYNELT